MVCICIIVCGLCGAYIHTGKNWYRWRQFQSGYRGQDGGSRCYGVGHGLSDKCPERAVGDQQLFLVLSGLATGASWLCYYRALQIGEASKVVPVDKLSVVITLVLAFVFLHEQFTVKSLIGCVLIGAGTLIMVI